MTQKRFVNRTPVISIIGRPNVGKSTLFNRLMGKMTKAITYKTPGVTRDRHYGITNWDESMDIDAIDVILVDTGGFYPSKLSVEEAENLSKTNKMNAFFNEMLPHAKQAIQESDLTLVIVDSLDGLLPLDEQLVKFVRKERKPFWVVSNKMDSPKQDEDLWNYYKLGVEEDQLFGLSAAHGRGVDELKLKLQHYCDSLKQRWGATATSTLQKGVVPVEKVAGQLALIGAPNAGKSTLLNRILGEERALVSAIAGTTMDPIEGYFDLYFGSEARALDCESRFVASEEEMTKDYLEMLKNGGLENLGGHYHDDGMEAHLEGNYWRSIKIVDTAGIRKKSSVHRGLESQSVFRALRSITDSDIVLMLIDATKGISHQDRRLCDIALEKGKSIIIVMNKIDLMEANMTRKEMIEWEKDMRFDMPFMDYCELIKISAKNGQGIKELLKSIRHTILLRRRPIPTTQVNQCLKNLVSAHTIIPKGGRGKEFKVRYASMVKASPPTFILYCNRSQNIPDNFRRYLQHGLRREFELKNTPVHLLFRTGSDLEKRARKMGNINGRIEQDL